MTSKTDYITCPNQTPVSTTLNLIDTFVKPLMSYKVILKLFRSLGTKTWTSKETNYFDVTYQKAAFDRP